MGSKARNSRAVGKRMHHAELGLCYVQAAVPGSFTMVDVKCLQRGKGWDDIDQQYKPVKRVELQADGSRSLKWDLTRRDEYGQIFTVHINTLTDEN